MIISIILNDISIMFFQRHQSPWLILRNAHFHEVLVMSRVVRLRERFIN